MKKLALFTSILVGSSAALSAGELENLRTANAEQKRQISTLETEIDKLYSLLDRETRLNGGKPHVKSSAVTSTTGATYTVVKGDTLSKIAKQYGTNVGAIMRANGLGSKSILRIGQKLKMPKATKTHFVSNKNKKKVIKLKQKQKEEEIIPKAVIVKMSNHTVVQGDTLYKIARTHKVSLKDLTKANPNLKPSAMRIGQKIQIPGGLTVSQLPKKSKVAVKKTVKQSVSKKAVAQKKQSTKKAVTILNTAKQVPINNTPKAKKTTMITAPAVMKSIYLDKPIKFSALAKKYGTTVDALNQLNDWNYPGTITLARGSEIFLPN